LDERSVKRLFFALLTKVMLPAYARAQMQSQTVDIHYNHISTYPHIRIHIHQCYAGAYVCLYVPIRALFTRTPCAHAVLLPTCPMSEYVGPYASASVWALPSSSGMASSAECTASTSFASAVGVCFAFKALAALRSAFVPSCFRGGLLPPVALRWLCFVRLMVQEWLMKGLDGCGRGP
jgi:hypothetical protein